MPITYCIDHEKKLVEARAHGALTDADVFGYQQEVWSRPDVAGYNEIVEMVDVKSIEFVSSERMRELANLSADMDTPNVSSKFAIIAHETLHYGLGRMYETFREINPKSEKKVHIFTSREDALRWLNAIQDADTPSKPA